MKMTLILFLFLLTSCQDKPETPVKNLILLIGDGMGPQQLSMATSYAKLAGKEPRKLAIEEMIEKGRLGMMHTFPYDALVADSAASATQLATGKMSRSEMIGLDYKGLRASSILELAKAKGKATGLVSNTRITHATPAAFAAHQIHRSMEAQIAEDLMSIGPDLMLSGGYEFFLPKTTTDLSYPITLSSKRQDEKDLLKLAKEKGYQLAFDKKTLDEVKELPVLGLFTPSAMADAISEKREENSPERKEANLKEMSQKAIELLSQDPDGFFLMIEGGQIDWAGHANDAGTLLHEMLRFDEVVAEVLAWAEGREDTLVVLTADHETGSFGFSYSKQGAPSPFLLQDANLKHEPRFNFGKSSVLDKIYAQKKSFTHILQDFDKLENKTPEAFQTMINENLEFKISLDQAKRILEDDQDSFPKIDEFSSFYVYARDTRSALVARQIASDQQIVWGTGTHTATPVFVIAKGKDYWQDKFSSSLHASEVGKLMMEALGVGEI